MSLTNAETAMNGVSLAERSRFQVERVRAADGRAARPTRRGGRQGGARAGGGHAGRGHAHAARQRFKPVTTVDELAALLSELGGVRRTGLLGLEVVWTPADPNDSMTETDVMTTYPELRSL